MNVTVRVPVPKQPTLAALERAIFRALQDAGRQLLVQAFGIVEERVRPSTSGRFAACVCECLVDDLPFALDGREREEVPS